MSIAEKNGLTSGLLSLEDKYGCIGHGALEAGGIFAQTQDACDSRSFNDGHIKVAVPVEWEPSPDGQGEHRRRKQQFDKLVSLHRHRLFDPEEPQDERDHDQKIKNGVVQALLFADEVPSKKGQEETTDRIISNHDPGHPNLLFAALIGALPCSSEREMRASSYRGSSAVQRP
jgi:hypothetical protein